jgi:hypothetical protein
MLLLPALALDGSAAPVPGQWRLLLKAPGIVDVAGPRADGRYVLSTQKGLLLFRPGGAAHPFANGAGGYRAGGGEPYLDLASGARVGASGCSFQRGDLFVLDAGSKPGIARVTPSGKASRFLDFAPGGFPSGIAFDRVGRFGHRLLVTVTMPNKTTTLYGVDCVAHASVIAKDAKRVEGGIVVAPTTFGAFGGRLIAADENSGGIYAFDRDGSVTLVVKPRLPSGADIGIESLGFVPPHVGPRAAVYFADLGAPKSPTPGHDSLLVLGGKDLARASVRPGELLAAMEGGGVTVAIRCRATCTVRHAARGLPGTHGEGHLTFRVT